MGTLGGKILKGGLQVPLGFSVSPLARKSVMRLPHISGPRKADENGFGRSAKFVYYAAMEEGLETKGNSSRSEYTAAKELSTMSEPRVVVNILFLFNLISQVGQWRFKVG